MHITRAGTISVLSGVLLIGAGCGGASKSTPSTTSATGSAVPRARPRPRSRAVPTRSARPPGPRAPPCTPTRTRHEPAGRGRSVSRSAPRAAPRAASVSYQYLLGGQVVARRSHYVFVGHFSDTLVWPASAVGYPLTFRAVVVAGGTHQPRLPGTGTQVSAPGRRRGARRAGAARSSGASARWGTSPCTSPPARLWR